MSCIFIFCLRRCQPKSTMISTTVALSTVSTTFANSDKELIAAALARRRFDGAKRVFVCVEIPVFRRGKLQPFRSHLHCSLLSEPTSSILPVTVKSQPSSAPKPMLATCVESSADDHVIDAPGEPIPTSGLNATDPSMFLLYPRQHQL
jgi:hypothetical protein